MKPCPEQPEQINSVGTGGPFYDCGLGPVGYRSPDPTALPHAFSDGLDFFGTSLCLQYYTPENWWTNFGQPVPDIILNGSDRIIHNESWTDGYITFTGERVVWKNVEGIYGTGGADGYILSESAQMIEIDGWCINEAPEPELSLMLMVGIIFITSIDKLRSFTKGVI